jgi:hypothetical protein
MTATLIATTAVVPTAPAASANSGRLRGGCSACCTADLLVAAWHGHGGDAAFSLPVIIQCHCPESTNHFLFTKGLAGQSGPEV